MSALNTGTEATLSQLHPTALFLVFNLTRLTDYEIWSMDNEYYFKTDMDKQWLIQLSTNLTICLRN
jgi:hypothetical protein